MFLLLLSFSIVITFKSAKELNNNCPKADFQVAQECTGKSFFLFYINS
jgi:hypothetical protein